MVPEIFAEFCFCNLIVTVCPGESVFSILKFEYLSENQTKIENILTHWSVAQAGSNGELNWRSKISLDCPFKSKQHQNITLSDFSFFYIQSGD